MRSKKMCVLAALVVTAVGLVFAQTKKPLTNDDVLQMVKAGFEQPMIVKAFEANDTNFDVSVQALMDLKTAGVSQPIIEAMLAAEAKKKTPPPSADKSAASPTSPSSPADPNNPLSPHAPGIYWLANTQGGQRLARLEASTYGGGKTSGMFGMGVTYGLKKMKVKAELAGPHAALRIRESSPEFWFYFEDAAQGFGRGPLAAQASKPEDFVLAKMESHEKERLLVVGQASLFGGSSGLRSKDVVAVQVQKVAPGIFKVTVSKGLDPGEYCFVPPGGVAAGVAGGQLFDFGIERAK